MFWLAAWQKVSSVSGLTHYRFRSVWSLGHPRDSVFEVLRDVHTYPAWWQEIKEVRELNEDRFFYRVRSLLPYWLEFESVRTVEDPVMGVLEAHLVGDLDGFTRWTVSEAGSATDVVFDEEVETRKRSLNLLAPVARPAFKVNHTLMMRHGRRGLDSYLARRRTHTPT